MLPAGNMLPASSSGSVLSSNACRLRPTPLGGINAAERTALPPGMLGISGGDTENRYRRLPGIALD